jgi:ADP-ribose pyrophosphatase YjhB (NUDIX family)
MNINNLCIDKKKYRCFCNNCNEKGNNCNEKGNIYNSNITPITSIGIITYFYDEVIKQYKYLIIKRRNTFGFVDFIRGKYSLYNKTHIQNLFNEMTTNEHTKILERDFDELWGYLWLNENNNIDYTAKNKFNSLKLGVNSLCSIKNFIDKSQNKWSEEEWGFPKGRRNYNENDFNAALREFNEETGIDINKINIIKNIKPYEECFIGSNYKAYKHKYYLARMDMNCEEDINRTIDMTKFQRSEVSDMGFYTKNEILQRIRNYNKERIYILEDIDKVLSTFNFKNQI